MTTRTRALVALAAVSVVTALVVGVPIRADRTMWVLSGLLLCGAALAFALAALRLDCERAPSRSDRRPPRGRRQR